jgi:disulfide bond formation protein DsbB
VFRQTKPVCSRLLIFRLAPILKPFGKHFNPVVFSPFPCSVRHLLFHPVNLFLFFTRNPLSTTAFSALPMSNVYQVSTPWFYLGWLVISVLVIVALIAFLFALLSLARFCFKKFFNTDLIPPSSTPASAQIVIPPAVSRF